MSKYSSRSEYMKQYRLKNKEKLSQQQKEYYAANKEKRSQQQKEYYAANKEKRSQQQKEWLKNSPVAKLRKIFSHRKYVAKNGGIIFDILFEDLPIMPEVCPILGIPLICSTTGVPTDNSPSIDKFLPELGYVKGNVFWISNKANRIKSDASLDEVIALVNWMKKTKKKVDKIMRTEDK